MLVVSPVVICRMRLVINPDIRVEDAKIFNFVAKK